MFRGRKIRDIRLPSAGVSHAVELEWYLAMHWWGYKPEEFEELEGDEQARRIAVYRLNNRIEAVVADYQNKERERQSRKNNRKH
jgi:hypothetical protein